ncbi:THUMP-like domain-containing protein [Algoriphagus boritolerans]|uniref:THUMP-like domain-containing protein n=1 Tax=Algoriphagus boritolerans TaxID=308111 RepID=UPI002FCDF393
MKALFPSGKVNVICRNYVTGAEELKKKLGLKDGGEDFLIGTKTGSGFKVFLVSPLLAKKNWPKNIKPRKIQIA